MPQTSPEACAAAAGSTRPPVAQLLSTFAVTRVLSDKPGEKKVALLGRFRGQEEEAVVLLSRQHFPVQECAEMLASCGSSVRTDFENDVYGKYFANPDPRFSTLVVDTVFPATQKHIQKHTQQEQHMVTETAEMYRRVVLPHVIEALPATRLQWVANILSKQSEADRLIFEDPDPLQGFMVHPDLKWDQQNLRQLYCVLLCHRGDVRSLRDINDTHLPLLRNMLSAGVQAITQRYNVPPDQLRCFIHYPPSYYHCHVHCVHVDWEGAGALVGRAHLLQDVIANITTFDAHYYQKCDLTYVVGENDDLWRRLHCSGIASHMA